MRRGSDWRSRYDYGGNSGSGPASRRTRSAWPTSPPPRTAATTPWLYSTRPARTPRPAPLTPSSARSRKPAGVSKVARRRGPPAAADSPPRPVFGLAVHEEERAVDGGYVRAAGVDCTISADRADGRSAVAVEPETPACGCVRPLRIRLPAERRTPGGSRRLGPAWRWVEAV